METDESTNNQLPSESQSPPVSNEETESESVSGPTARPQFRNRINIGALEQNFQDLQNTINSLVTPPEEPYEEQEVQSQISNSTSFRLMKSRSCRANLMTSSSPPEFENTPPNDFEKGFPGRPERKLWELPPPEYGGAASGGLLRSDSQSSLGSTLLDEAIARKGKTSGEEDIPSVDTFVAGLKKMAKLQYDQVCAL